MTKILVVLFIALTFESIGVIMLSKGLRKLESPASYSPAEIGKLLVRGATNKSIVFGVFFEALFFAGLLFMMSQADVSFVWPLTALTFVFSTLAAKFYLHEQVSALRWAGVFFIVCGAGLITYSEKARERETIKEKAQAFGLESGAR
jgi:drug/metabolite transporter (DMT)-like permease